MREREIKRAFVHSRELFFMKGLLEETGNVMLNQLHDEFVSYKTTNQVYYICP